VKSLVAVWHEMKNRRVLSRICGQNRRPSPRKQTTVLASVKGPLADSAAAPPLTPAARRGPPSVGDGRTGPPAGAPDTGCRASAEMDPGKVTGRLDHNVVVVNHLGRHRDFNHPQILLRTRTKNKLAPSGKRRCITVIKKSSRIRAFLAMQSILAQVPVKNPLFLR